MSAAVRQLVDRGLALRAEIAAREAELKRITIALEGAALTGEQVPLEDADREGRQYLARGSTLTVPVIISADVVLKSFADGSKIYARLQELAGMVKLRKFYEPETTWKARFAGGKELRATAAEVLGAAAPAFVTACVQRDKNGIPKNKIAVEWSRATDNAAVTPKGDA
jgi:hypothetical protein